ncbi:MAG: hypothetical protein J6Y29_00970 [Clostridiales bacterium]|nr:hypothetical protein [Clostridiales bacterium]
MITGLKKLTGFRLKDAMAVLNKLQKYKYTFDITKAPSIKDVPITEDFRVLRVTKVDKDVINILVCI